MTGLERRLGVSPFSFGSDNYILSAPFIQATYFGEKNCVGLFFTLGISPLAGMLLQCPAAQKRFGRSGRVALPATNHSLNQPR